jgi:C-terminal processing protease CtpA/Prc
MRSLWLSLFSVNYAQNYLNMHDKYDDNNRTFRSEREPSGRSTMKDTSSYLSKVGSGLSNLNESAIFSDDDSFEEQFAKQDECFEVRAPPGKLGIIVDLSDNGEPCVRAVRSDSVLANEVKIGDRLISVDGEICTDMSAEHVSKLIAVKSNQECRKIMFVRRSPNYM